MGKRNRRRSRWQRGGLAAALLLALGPGLALPAAAKASKSSSESASVSEDERDLYRDLVTAAKRGEWTKANTLARRADDKLTVAFAEWLYLTDDDSTPSFDALSDFLAAHPSWPSHGAMLTKAELALPLDMNPKAVVSWFGDRDPRTGDGALKLGEAKIALGERSAGEAILRGAWIEREFTGGGEQRMVAEHGALIQGAPTSARVARLLWQRRTGDANRILDGADSDGRILAKARMTLITQPQRSDDVIAGLPSALRNDSGILFDETRAAHRNGDTRAALPLALRADPTAAASRWWPERHLLARESVALGLYQEAYRLASEHGLTEGADFADAEWLSGWIALRFLDNPSRAAEHFMTLYKNVSFPVSKARGAYWAARADEAAGRLAEAARLYQVAASYETTYYGQLAAVRIARDKPTITLPEGPSASMKDAGFAASELAHATRIAGSTGSNAVARPFFIALGEAADTPEQYGYASQLALALGYPGFAVRIAKKAMQQDNIVLTDIAYPTLSVPHADGPEPALVLGISRQESEFDTRAESPAGALGLMQLMPATAKHVAKDEHIRYEPARLEDPSYNMRLGMAYLGGLIDRFGGSYALAIAAYNAGPTNTRRWMEDSGDPRDPNVDPIDWVEKIPFPETRNYVQRVLENTQVYRSRLASKSVAPLRIAEDLARPNAPRGAGEDLTAYLDRESSAKVASAEETKPPRHAEEARTKAETAAARPEPQKPAETAPAAAAPPQPIDVASAAPTAAEPVPPPVAATAPVADPAPPFSAPPKIVPQPKPAPPGKSAVKAKEKDKKVAAKGKRKSKHPADEDDDQAVSADTPPAPLPSVNPFGNGQPESRGAPSSCSRMILDLSGKMRCADRQASNG